MISRVKYHRFMLKISALAYAAGKQAHEALSIIETFLIILSRASPVLLAKRSRLHIKELLFKSMARFVAMTVMSC